MAEADVNEKKDEENLNESESQTDDKGNAGDASAQEELINEVKALKSQFERSQADNEALRESVRLQSRLLESQGNKKTTSNPELDEARKILSPLFKEDIDSSLNPVIGTVSKLYDQTDSVNFQLYLQRNDPESLQGDAFDRVSQVIESVRQKAARDTGSWLSRLDAFHYAKGAGLIKPAGKKANNASEKRQEAERKQAGINTNSEKKTTNAPNVEIQKISEKAHAGIRLTAEERAKWKEALSNVPL